MGRGADVGVRAARARWLDEVAGTLAQAQEVLWELEKAGVTEPALLALYAQFEALAAELRAVRRNSKDIEVAALDPEWTILPPWQASLRGL